MYLCRVYSFGLLGILLLGFATASQAEPRPASLDQATRARCLQVLREGMQGGDFWPAIHAAEGLTLGGHGQEVLEYWTARLAREQDDQRRCGIARELVRAGDRRRARVMLDILAGTDPHGHVHAAESLYKVVEIGDGSALRRIYSATDNPRLKLMAAGALARCGNPEAKQFLRDMLNHEDPELYTVAAWILGRIGDASDIPRLKAQIPRCATELCRAYIEHSLAALGDAEATRALARNLSSQDPAVRTYAATFAGDAYATHLADQLIAMLDDPHGDARIRAAQSLLVLSGSPPKSRQDLSVLVYPSSAEFPRYTEGSIVELNDGSLLFAVTEFQDRGSDFDAARIVARRSTDGGYTWSDPYVLQENTGQMNVMSVTLRRLQDGRLALFYLEKNSHSDLDLVARFSEDDAQTFGPPVLVTTDDGYHVVNNDRITQLAGGRLLAPAASTPDVHKVNHFVSHCYLSDDGGRTWRKGKGSVDAPRRGAMEPEVIELSDGRILMLIRNQLGFIGKSYSEDGGETWSEMESLGLVAPEAPATVRRIPATGHLMLVWNNTYTPGVSHGGRRTPLTVALSKDEGDTWQVAFDLEQDPQRSYSYTSLTFVGGRAVMSYWESDAGGRQLSCRFRSVNVDLIESRNSEPTR